MRAELSLERYSELAEYIADLVNHGLDDVEIARRLQSAGFLAQFGHMVDDAHLVGAIRRLMDGRIGNKDS